MDVTELIKTFVILVAVIDPIGNIPVYIALTSQKTDAEHKSIALKTSCAAVLLLAVSFLFGKYITNDGTSHGHNSTDPNSLCKS